MYRYLWQKEGNDWVNDIKWRVPDSEVDDRGLTKKTVKHKLNREDAMDHSRWRKFLKDG